jgi:hypothetical protein
MTRWNGVKPTRLPGGTGAARSLRNKSPPPIPPAVPKKPTMSRPRAPPAVQPQGQGRTIAVLLGLLALEWIVSAAFGRAAARAIRQSYDD